MESRGTPGRLTVALPHVVVFRTLRKAWHRRDLVHRLPVRDDGRDAEPISHFEEVVLRPQVTIVETTQTERAMMLHTRADEMCIIANSVSFKVRS